MPEMLAMPSRAAAGMHPFAGRKLQIGLGEDRVERAPPLRADAGAIDCDPRIDERALDVVALEHLAGVGPQLLERVLRTTMALLRAVAEPDGPFARVAHVVGELLRALCRYCRERCVFRGGQRLEEGMGEARIEQLAQNGDGEIAVWLLDEEDVAVLAGVAPIGERILVASPPLHLARIGIERARLADQIEGDVAKRKVLLEHWRMAAPLREAMAEHERIIGEPERVGEERCLIGSCHYE